MTSHTIFMNAKIHDKAWHLVNLIERLKKDTNYFYNLQMVSFDFVDDKSLDQVALIIVNTATGKMLYITCRELADFGNMSHASRKADIAMEYIDSLNEVD